MSTKTIKPKAKVKAKAKPPIVSLTEVIIEAIRDKKGEEITSFDLRSLGDAVTDIFILCHATSKVQVKAIADHIIEKTRLLLNEKPWHSEGRENYEWVLLDYVDLVVHIFLKEKREFYQIEDLWQDAQRIDHE